MKKFAKIAYRGGVLALSSILVLSLMFASCDNSSNSDEESSIDNTTSNNNQNSNGNSGSNNNSNSNNNNNNNSNDDNADPSQTLPDKVGENPIKETIKLIDDKWGDYYLELSPNGTALYVTDDDEPIEELNYTYNVDKKEIQMQVKKIGFYSILGNNGLMTYSEIISYTNNFTVEKIREVLREMYEEDKNKEWFKDDYPNCNSYEDYEQAYFKGFNSVEAALEYEIQVTKLVYKAIFGALATYSYEIDSDGKMTLTEKFTGVKNLFESSCEYHESETHVRIYNSEAYFEDSDNDEYFNGFLDTDEKKIVFKSEDDDKTVTAEYTENISAETVTLKFNNKEYTCKFEGVNFIQE